MFLQEIGAAVIHHSGCHERTQSLNCKETYLVLTTVTTPLALVAAVAAEHQDLQTSAAQPSLSDKDSLLMIFASSSC
jgi:hypothetical protein